MGALSMDIRIRIVRAVDAGKTLHQIADELQVGERTISKLIKQRRDGLGLEPLYSGRCGRPRKLKPADEERLRQDVCKHPDSTLFERIQRLKLPIQIAQTWRWLSRMGFTHKKRRSLPANASARMWPPARIRFGGNRVPLVAGRSRGERGQWTAV